MYENFIGIQNTSAITINKNSNFPSCIKKFLNLLFTTQKKYEYWQIKNDFPEIRFSFVIY